MNRCNTPHQLKLFLRRLVFCLGVTLAMAATGTAAAGTIVNFSTPLGDFSLELFDDVAPGTVANFLNYVDSGRYDSVIVHRSILGFVIQGGLLSADEQQNTVSQIVTDPNILNEFNISNTRGTIAMAKLGGQANSASSQWFINTGDNSSLDSVDGGFTVFGRVLDDGMDVVDAINALFTTTVFFSAVGNLADFPLINFSGGSLTLANLGDVSISVAEDLSNAPNVFDESTALLNIQVDAGAAGLAALSLAIISTAPDTVIQGIPESVESLTASVDKIATFDDSSGRLVIPELVIAGAVAFRDVVFVLSDVEQLQFTLESFQQ